MILGGRAFGGTLMNGICTQVKEVSLVDFTQRKAGHIWDQKWALTRQNLLASWPWFISIQEYEE
jgi:hypothetical protein